MTPVTVTALALLLTGLAVQAEQVDSLSCLCKCGCTESNGTSCLCPCPCDVPMTVCYPGFVKVCPQKRQGCPKKQTTFCEKEARLGVDNIKKWLNGGGATESRKLEEAETRGKSDILQEVHCKDGKTPKFKCTFKLDYEPYGKVERVSPTKCTHRKNFENCPVEIRTKEGCTITTKLRNDKNKVLTVGKISLKCPPTTVDPLATTVVTVPPPPPATTTINPYGHAGDNITVIGDGCTCVPQFLMALGTTSPSLEADQKNNKPPPGMKLIRNNIRTDWIQCLGVPKFKCTFIFDTDKYCDHVYNMETRKCTHRRQVTRCPIELTTKLGCKLKLKITNVQAKMKVASNVQISGGPTRTKGFLENCVCISK